MGTFEERADLAAPRGDSPDVPTGPDVPTRPELPDLPTGPARPGVPALVEIDSAFERFGDRVTVATASSPAPAFAGPDVVGDFAGVPVFASVFAGVFAGFGDFTGILTALAMGRSAARAGLFSPGAAPSRIGRRKRPV